MRGAGQGTNMGVSINGDPNADLRVFLSSLWGLPKGPPQFRDPPHIVMKCLRLDNL